MIGTTPLERRRSAHWKRVVADQSVLCRLYYLHMGPSFLQSLRGFAYDPKVAAAVKPTFDNNLHTIEVRMGDYPFVAGAKPTVADCHLYAVLSAGVEKFNYVISDDFPRLQRWYKNFQRPSERVGGQGRAGFSCTQKMILHTPPLLRARAAASWTELLVGGRWIAARAVPAAGYCRTAWGDASGAPADPPRRADRGNC